MPRASTVLRYLPRHSVEARGMSVETRGRSAVARGVSAVVRGTPWIWPWNAVEVRGHCRGAPPNKQIMYIPLLLRGHRRDAHKGLAAGRGAAMWWLRLQLWMTYAWSYPAGGERNGGKSPTTLALSSSSIASLTRAAPSKDGPCPRASVEEPFVQFGRRNRPE